MFQLVAEAILLHGHLGVAQQVLLLGQFCLGVENLQVEIRVAQPDDDLPLLDHGSLFGHALRDDAALLRRELNHLNGNHLPGQAHIVFEFRLQDLADGEIVRADTHGGTVVAEDYPDKDEEDEKAPGNVRQMLALQAFLLFDEFIHNAY